MTEWQVLIESLGRRPPKTDDKRRKAATAKKRRDDEAAKAARAEGRRRDAAERVATTLLDAGSTANMGPVIHMAKIGKKAAGRLLDGIEHNGFPIISK